MSLRDKILTLWSQRVKDAFIKFNKENEYKVSYKHKEGIFIIKRSDGFACAAISNFEILRRCSKEEYGDTLPILFNWIDEKIKLDKGFLTGCEICSATGYSSDNEFCDCKFGKEKQKEFNQATLYEALDNLERKDIQEVLELYLYENKETTYD